MTRAAQKDREIMFAKRAMEMLGDTRVIAPSPDENSWPDLVIDGDQGLEVRELYGDEGKSGSKAKAEESQRIASLMEIADQYYRECAIPARIKIHSCEFNGSLAGIISSTVRSLDDWGRQRVQIDDSSWMYVLRLPAECGEYRRWDVISDSVGWVGTIGIAQIQDAIADKSTKLHKYVKSLKSVSLLIVCDRMRNAGKWQFPNLEGMSTRGFTSVICLSFPDQVKVVTRNRVAGGFSPPAPTPPGMRVRTGRFTESSGP